MSATASKRAGILATVFAAGALTLGIGSPVANAAEDCGFGRHLDNGVCVQNLPGPGAQFDPEIAGFFTSHWREILEESERGEVK